MYIVVSDRVFQSSGIHLFDPDVKIRRVKSTVYAITTSAVSNDDVYYREC